MEGIMETAMTLFSGGGLADVALLAAGYSLVAGVEIEPEIAAVANKNLGGHVRVMDILNADPHDFPACDLLHASPPCTNASIAKAGAKETKLDKAMARKVAEFVMVLKPTHFTLENVRGYRKFESFKIITDALTQGGYKYRVCILNSASFGVPQTRIRLIVLASLSHLPSKPQPTHQRARNSQESLFESRLPNWIGWYEAIQDLIPTLPESKFADWQLARLPAEMQTILVDSAGFNDELGKLPVMRDFNEPCGTVLSNYKHRKLNAFIIGGGNTNKEIIDSKARFYDSPAFTVAADSGIRNTRAFIVDGQETVPSKDGRVASTRNEAEPYLTISATTYKGMPKAWLEQGKVVSMTPRALARFQSIPDWYELPSKNVLACKIVGNAIPPLMAQRIFEQFDF